jgi:hypothetical protein
MFTWNAASNEYLENVDHGYVPRFIRHYAKGWACCGHSGYYATATDCLNAVSLQDDHDSLAGEYI